MTRTFKRSPLALAILVLLYEAPMHPYRMQRLIKERGKDRVINVERRGSLYQTIGQLERAGLIAVRRTARRAHRPERTIYELTDLGRQTALEWLRGALSTPSREFPEFPAAVSFLALLAPEDAAEQLAQRAAALKAEIAEIERVSAEVGDALPRLFLLEDELLQATLSAELAWVRAVIEDLRSGELDWSEEWLRRFASSGSEDET